MNLKLFLHPLSSYCHKAILAFYENDTPFEPVILGESSYSDQLKKIWPLGKFPVLVDEGRNEVVPESSIIIEYLAQHYPGRQALIPADPDEARKVRLQDRFVDLYLHAPVQKVVGDRLRPADQKDPFGVEEARRTYHTALGMLESRLADRPWLMGEQFTLADCAAAPALFYGNMVCGSLDEGHARAAAYLRRLMARPAYARVLREAEPYMHLVPR
jgi:glutathione S-transferase